MKTTSRIAAAIGILSMATCMQPLHAAAKNSQSNQGEASHFSLEIQGAGSLEPTENCASAHTLTPQEILHAAHQQYWYDQITYAELLQQYHDGICTITPIENGYQVKAGGGLGSVEIWDGM